MNTRRAIGYKKRINRPYNRYNSTASGLYMNGLIRSYSIESCSYYHCITHYTNKKGTSDAQSEVPYISTVAVYKNFWLISPDVSGWIWHLFTPKTEVVAKASQGQFPLPFWISDAKNAKQRYGEIYIPYKIGRLFCKRNVKW